MQNVGAPTFNFPGQTDFYRGKVRDVYYLDELLVVVASDRIDSVSLEGFMEVCARHSIRTRAYLRKQKEPHIMNVNYFNNFVQAAFDAV